MKRFFILALIILSLKSGACFRAKVSSVNNLPDSNITANQDAASIKTLEKPTQIKEENKPDKAQQPIRKIDFKNFTYPWFPLYPSDKKSVIIKKQIVLRNGENEIKTFPALRYGGPQTEIYQESLADVSYFDLTGDGKDEAIVTVGVEFNRWFPQCIFVYQEENGKAKLLWKYELNALNYQSDSFLQWRGHKVINNNLVIEEYPVRFLEVDKCPEQFFRKTFSWDGKTFQEKSGETIPFNETKCEKITGYPGEDSAS
jgi:hypothetical protein